jgi:drug/metabolite transporter (DMT)-like permease
MSKSASSPKPIYLLGISANVATRPTSQVMRARAKGIYAALASAIFLGMTPVFGKQAIISGASPLAVVALRTLLAAVLLFGVLLVFDRRYLYIYPAGLLGCLLAGWTNGIGSLFYYNALARLDASVGHLLYSLYPMFLLIWLSLDHQPANRLTLFRLLLIVPAIYLLTQARAGQVDLIGIGQMLVAAALYALHIPINQRVLYEMPAPTVTAYTLLAMSTIVVPVYLLSGVTTFPAGYQVWMPILGLTLVTFLSRLTLFLGVKHLGGMQTALLGLSELLVAVFFSYLLLGERFSHSQWLGASLLTLSLLMVVFERPVSQKNRLSGWLSWIRNRDGV